jgi:hypothetical protein
MGCDIHGFCEVKKNGVWKLNTKPIFKNPYYLSDSDLQLRKLRDPSFKRVDDLQKAQYLCHPGTGRNYDWFAILADVRNGRGFAGIPTGEGFAVIAEPRGVPEDCTTKWAKEVEEWGGDLHSHSYLRVQDFDDFDWSQKTILNGIIPLDEYKTLRVSGESPETWSGMISGPDVVVVDQEAADQILEGHSVVVNPYEPIFSHKEKNATMVSQKTNKRVYVNYRWEVEYREWFAHKIEDVVEGMRGLEEKYEDVRYVFAFDN